MKLRDFLEKWDLGLLKFQIGQLEAEFYPRDADRKAAHELYVELSTRIVTQATLDREIDPNTLLNCTFALFGIIREILKSNGPDCPTVEKLTLAVLNQIIRPFTAKWHRPAPTNAFQHGQEREEFFSEFGLLQRQLRSFAEALAEIANDEHDAAFSESEGSREKDKPLDTAPPKVFISYSHKDEAWRRIIKEQLSRVSSAGQFTLWDDSEILPGSDWATELKRQRSLASAVLMLISSEYLASQSVREEIDHLLEQKERRGLQFIPILVSPCDWQNVDWLRRIQIYPEKARPLSSMAAADQRAAILRFAEVFMSLLGISASEVAFQQTSTAKPDKRLIVLVHGIRTRAEWQGRLKHLFEADGQTIVEPVGYEYFDVFRFLCPLWTRKQPIEVVLRKIRTALSLHAGKYDEFIIVAHSFGTFIVGKILADEFDIRPDRLLLCGCIQPSSFAWERLPNRPNLILNEVGSRDIWPILAKSITWGYGSTGTFGFQTPGVRDRYHNLAHSDYFKPGFAEEFWIPWIRDCLTKPTPFETGSRPPTPFYKNFFEVIPLKWVLLTSVGLAAYLLRQQILALTIGGP